MFFSFTHPFISISVLVSQSTNNPKDRRSTLSLHSPVMAHHILPNINLSSPSTSLRSVKILDALNSITIPNLQMDDRVTGSKQTTIIDPEVIKPSVVAALNDRPAGSNVSAITIQTSDSMLDVLDSVLCSLIKPDALLDGDIIKLLEGLPVLMGHYTVGQENTHYPLCKGIMGSLASCLYNAEVYKEGEVVSKREWVIDYNGPKYKHGKTDLLGEGMDRYGTKRPFVLWEYKRDAVLTLRLLITIYRLADEGQGIVIDLDGEGEVMVSSSDDDALNDVKSFIYQVGSVSFLPSSEAHLVTGYRRT